MASKIVMGLAAVALAAGLVGCDSAQKDEASLLKMENEELRVRNDDLASSLESVNLDLREALDGLQAEQDQTSRLQAKIESSPSAAMANAPAIAFGSIDGVTTTVGSGQVTMTIAGDLLFDSGRTTLKKSFKRNLDQVASQLNSGYAGKSIKIAGHTDGDPIRKSGHRSNYHLAFERGWAVRDYLVTKGVSASRIAIESHGPNKSMATKAQSRRVEIVVVN